MASTSTVPSKIDSEQSSNQSSSSTTSIRHKDSNLDTSNINSDWDLSKFLILERVKV